MRPLALAASTLLLAAPAIAQSPQIPITDAAKCTNLQQLQLDQAHVLSAEVVPAGTFVSAAAPHRQS